MRLTTAQAHRLDRALELGVHVIFPITIAVGTILFSVLLFTI